MSSKGNIFNFLDEADAYIRSLTLHGRSILLSSKKTAFKGMLINIMSLRAVVLEYVDTGIIDVLPTFRMSQDLLESLFGRIRSLNGNNDNPNVEQFSSALRKLLVHNEIQSSELSNCIDQLKIFTISSFKKKDIDTVLENNESDENSNDIASFRGELFSTNDNILDVFKDSTIIRMASEIENKIRFVARFDCQNCIDVLDNDDKICSDFHKFKPSLSSVLIGKVVYKYANIFKNKRTITYNLLLETILKNIKLVNTFPNFSCEDDHKQYFINFFVQEFIRMHNVYVAKTETLNEQRIMLRSKLRNAVHFSGQ